MTMTSDAKKALSKTIRDLRGFLLRHLSTATEAEYRLSIKRAHDAGLDEARDTRRRRLEEWMDEQLRADVQTGKKGARTRDDFFHEAILQAAYTLLNRLVILRLMEAAPAGGRALRPTPVLSRGLQSAGYKDFRALAPALVKDDATEGFEFLLKLVFEELASDLPGIFGPAGVADLIPLTPAILNHLVSELNQPELDSCWTDDMTLGWVYQYWNDPAREALDAKLNSGGKVEPHEIASKTQMFTERYMVDWLLQNSLGPMWHATCQKHGWTPLAESSGTLAALEERRKDWRAKREAGPENGGVALTELMPLHTQMEHHWAYYIPQPIPEDAVKHAPETLRDLKLIDPAVGSGHFLVVALDMLVPLYREEAQHRGEQDRDEWQDTAIVERILSVNLHGIDLDPRAVQIAAAALFLKARQIAPNARPENLNLVASNLSLASLADDDPALVQLREEVEQETGIPAALTDTLVHALRGADHLGSLLKINTTVDEALTKYELGKAIPDQGDLLGGFAPKQPRQSLAPEQARETLLDRLEKFLKAHTRGDDLGLRLRGQQLAAGVRFVRMVREGTYDLVVANPPYQGTSKMEDTTYITKNYPLGKADLYAAFLLRGLELVREGGVSSMLTMRNWMFIKQYSGLRQHIFGTFDLRGLGDFAVGAFDEVPNDVLSVVVSVVHRSTHRPDQSIALQPTAPDDNSYDRARTQRKRAATLCHEGRHTFDPLALRVVPEWPLVYWWDETRLTTYGESRTIGDLYQVKQGLCTGNNDRTIRLPWEVNKRAVPLAPTVSDLSSCKLWLPFIKGGEGRVWHEPLSWIINWRCRGLEIRVGAESKTLAARPQNEAFYMKQGVAIQTLGGTFSGRWHRFPSIFGDMARTVFGEESAAILCLLNSRESREIASSLNPTIHFTVGDLARLPFQRDLKSSNIFGVLELSGSLHEAHREPSVEFKKPGPSPWKHVQEWAQIAVDRENDEPLPEYFEELDPEPPTDHLSFALGVALGRFGAHGEGILDPAKDDLSNALPHAILFLDTTLEKDHFRDGLGHNAAKIIHQKWAEFGAEINSKKSLREWLANDFFKDIHRQMYENRPIHWPLSSSNKTFVAWVNIHRMGANTLRVLLADHLHPTMNRIDGALNDLRAARNNPDKKTASAAEKEFDRLTKAKTELEEFIQNVEACAERGAPPTDAKCPEREIDAVYDPTLDDGVMINSAALWPLLEPQWKDPKKWWKELAQASGKKDYDWSHLAMRYWPTRVDKKCQEDPSLGVAHGCFWRYHAERARAWELRLQDEIQADFKITEAPYRPGGRNVNDGGDIPHREAYLRDHALDAIAGVEKEAERRMGRGTNKKLVPTMTILESGLWSNFPAEIWEMELRLSKKQGIEFRLLSPDEEAARTTFATSHPHEVRNRETILRNLVPPEDMFEDDEIVDDDDLDSSDEESPTPDNVLELRPSKREEGKLNVRPERSGLEQLVALREYLYALHFGIREPRVIVARIKEWSLANFDESWRSSTSELASDLGFVDAVGLTLSGFGNDFITGLESQTEVLEKLLPQIRKAAFARVVEAIEAGQHESVFYSEAQPIQEMDSYNEAAYRSSLPGRLRVSEEEEEELVIPDAHQLVMLTRLLEGIALNLKDKDKLRWYLGVKTIRTVDRYTRLGKQVGLIMEDRGLSAMGREFVINSDRRLPIAREAFREWAVIKEVLALYKSISNMDKAAEKVIRARTRLQGETVTKRARSLGNWIVHELKLVQGDLF
ncbi:BREX-6 system adenine-specific DNA-methyltransferase PglX [Microvenator marinus]|uniref:site-specific DNA-methyltransferase (adenine-specific) n=1 Tax=Microvenator marinus TaxID=2600177 RepID=A0A5B8XTK1_9DELT|nr:BREX-6 system adenine-specific DNA-methyltransferase PglX [Microvenator marinus]QED28437.1 BREX-6 system adenine-specific DNA-methyltransferase PglX [Microvenator marinus]